MGELRSAVDETLACDPRDLSRAELGERLVELEREMARLSGAFSDTLAEFDARGVHLDDRSRSTAAWLVHQCRMSAQDAAVRVRVARRLRGLLPGTRAALREGEISWSHARVIAEQVGQTVEVLEGRAGGEVERALVGELVGEAEPVLVDAARRLDPRDTGRVARRWRHMVDQDGFLADAEDDHDRRRLHVSVLPDDRVRIDGDLYGADGQAVLAAITALAAPQGPHDRRLPRQRRADALAELSRRALDGGSLPEAGGERPHVLVEVGLDTLERRLGCAPGELARVGPIAAETARRLACDASVTRVITGPDSQPLDIGRKTRVVPPAIRRALVHRDRGCVWDGCDALPEWTDAHHVRHWADGGPTDLGNLQLLCRRHHRAVHEGYELEHRRLRRPPPQPDYRPYNWDADPG